MVAVTGDTYLDIPVLKKADIGLSNDLLANVLVKEASDVLLLDGSINSIVSSIMWGRNIYDCVKKFIVF